jgi:hypothetical protein
MHTLGGAKMYSTKLLEVVIMKKKNHELHNPW